MKLLVRKETKLAEFVCKAVNITQFFVLHPHPRLKFTSSVATLFSVSFQALTCDFFIFVAWAEGSTTASVMLLAVVAL